jgi:hypothetical protein
VKKKNSFFEAKAAKLTFQLGSRNKAKVAIANKIAKIIYKMLTDKTHTMRYKDPGIAKVKTSDQKIKNHLKQLEKLGVKVNYSTKENIINAVSEYNVKV